MKNYLPLLVLALPLSEALGQDLLATYEQALQRDPTVHQAEFSRNAAMENKPQSIAALLPTLSVSGYMNRTSLLSKGNLAQILVSGGTNLDYWNSGASLDLKQPVYHHDLWVKLSQADNQVAAAEATYEAAQQGLIVRTATAYFNILFAEDSLEFARMERQSIERQLEQAKARFEVGLVAITDVDAAQAGFDQARANEIKAENDLDNAREAIRVIVGQFEGNIAGLADNIELKSPEPADMEAWNRLAQESNLLIIAAQNQAEQSKKNIDVQFSGHLPTLDLVGTAAFTDNLRKGLYTESQVVGMQLNIPLFQGGMVNSKSRQASEQFQADMENLDVQRRDTINKVKTAYRGVITSISQSAALKSAVTSAKSALEATEAGFNVGTRTMIDVLLVQSKLFQAKRDYAKSRYDFITNSLTLKQAAGMLGRQDVEWVNRWLVKN